MKRIIASIVFACVVALMAFVFNNHPFSPKGEGLRSSLAELGESVTQPQDRADLARAMAAFRALPRPAPCRDKRILILYDSTGPWGHLGEIDALFAANLAGRWASYDAMPVSTYRSGDVETHSLTVYLGTSFDEAIPPALVEDLGASERPLIWVQYGLEKLAEAMPGFEKRYGLVPGLVDRSGFSHVNYNGVSFTFLEGPEAELATTIIRDHDKVKVQASAVRNDGTSIPWAVRTGNLTFIAGNPFSTISASGRYLVFADLFARILAPEIPSRHRALVRIEDVGPDARPSDMRAIADYFHARNVPFSVAVYDTFIDPGRSSPSLPEKITMEDAPEFIEALKYMVAKGGTLIMHGHTHQLGAMANPYSGKSAADFEFFRAHIDADDNVVLDGPDERDSFSWASDRLDLALAAWSRAGLPRPEIFEFPYYAGSALDYMAVGSRFRARYEQSIYYIGTIDPSSTRQGIFTTQFFPYPVIDVYGQVVIPENMGNYSLLDYNQHPARSPSELLEIADRNRVLRDGFASFYFHWYLDLDRLKEVVEPLQA
ncbi:MAG: DUF2334 domain-containing protein [Parvibaculum sp.]